MFVAMVLVTTARAATIRVGVAVSLREAMEDIAKAYHADSGDAVEYTFGSSGQIAAQIKNGADIDAFISAANEQVDELALAHLVEAETRRAIAGNDLVLIVPADAAHAPADFGGLAKPSVKRVAIGEPKTVPAGRYAAQVLKSLKLSDALAGRLVYGTNVRQVLGYVERGEVSAGIVYATDAKLAGDKVKVVAVAKPDTHEPIVYPAVVMKASREQAAAKRFLDYLSGKKARQILADKGFAPPAPPATRKAAQ